MSERKDLVINRKKLVPFISEDSLVEQIVFFAGKVEQELWFNKDGPVLPH